MDCQCLKDCIFFNDRMKNMPSMSEVLKQQYCRGDWEHCARCVVFLALGREAVPKDLFPDELDRARRLVREAQH